MKDNRYYNPFEAIEKNAVNAKKVCPQCNANNRIDFQFCESCGYSFFDEKKQENSNEKVRVVLPTLTTNNNTKTRITKTPFTLGKDANAVDMVIDSNVISRRHATIVSEGTNYFIIDNNSKNGTFINGKKLFPNQKISLNSNDIICLANVNFVFDF